MAAPSRVTFRVAERFWAHLAINPPIPAKAGIHGASSARCMNLKSNPLDPCLRRGLRRGAKPVSSVYVDHPGEVPEEQFRTEIYRAVG